MTYARLTPLEAADLPLADRQSIACFIDVWNELTEASERVEKWMDEVRAAHRSDCLARYGEDIFGDGK